MEATEANGQPAARAWYRGEPFGLAVLTVADDGITAITLFGDPRLAAAGGAARRGRVAAAPDR